MADPGVMRDTQDLVVHYPYLGECVQEIFRCPSAERIRHFEVAGKREVIVWATVGDKWSYIP
jgi:hypothetical protein